MVATVSEISPKTIGKWVDFPTSVFLIDDASKENNTLSSDDDQSGSDVEILSTPR